MTNPVGGRLPAPKNSGAPEPRRLNVDRQKYHNIKAKVKKGELSNFDKIILVPCSGNNNWFEIAEHSALFYYYEVCQKLGTPVTFYADHDSYVVQYDIGYIRCCGIDTVRKRLKSRNLYKTERNHEGCVIFYLNTRFTKAEVEKLEQTELARRLKNNSIITINHSDPAFHQILIALSTRLTHACEKQLTRFSSQVFGVTVTQLMDDTILYYYEHCTEKTPTITAATWQYLGANIKKLLYYIELASEKKLWPRKLCLDLGNLALDAEKHIAKRLFALDRSHTPKGGAH